MTATRQKFEAHGQSHVGRNFPCYVTVDLKGIEPKQSNMPENDEVARQKAKETFRAALKKFAYDLRPSDTTEDGQWAIKGFLDVFKNVYTITADTKIVSKILEIHLFPRLLEFAAATDFKIVLTDHQNWYPDFSFVNKNDLSVRFAVDLKTTYRLPHRPEFVNGFTLGSHGEYFQDRSSTKNIQFPYDTYLGHFCLGLIYSRTDLLAMAVPSAEPDHVAETAEDLAEMEIYSVEELGSKYDAAPNLKHRAVKTLRDITSVMTDLEFFACEKWELASDRQGSGNTANIGSIQHIGDILNGCGVFSRLGEACFDEYWKNYGKISTLVEKKDRKISDLRNYLAFKGLDPSLAHYRAERRLKPVFARPPGPAPRNSRR